MSFKILRIKEVCQKTGLSRSTIYVLISQDLFPKSVGLASRRVGWIESEIDDWIQQKKNDRDY
ncbi:MAG: helix-turn-helix transcriptional regulator [Methylomicrobium sp.]